MLNNLPLPSQRKLMRLANANDTTVEAYVLRLVEDHLKVRSKTRTPPTRTEPDLTAGFC